MLGHVNRLLARHGRRLGPDPASTNIACVGGVIANNSGGMRCGVVADSYQHRQRADAGAGQRRRDRHRRAGRRGRVRRRRARAGRGPARRSATSCAPTPSWRSASRRKFQIKNTTGYRLCAFLDADTPLEIFRRLVVGSEGTLAFVAEAVFDTVPLGRHTTLALVGFEDLDAAAGAVDAAASHAGATATELMVAPTLIAAAYNMPGHPGGWKELPPTSAALLIEFRAETPEAARAAGGRRRCEILRSAAARWSARRPAFSRARRRRSRCCGACARACRACWRRCARPGVQMIIEDVCVPPARVAEAAKDLQALLAKHGFLPGLAGHASAGNLHFILTAEFGKEGELERYDAFIARAWSS